VCVCGVVVVVVHAQASRYRQAVQWMQNVLWHASYSTERSASPAPPDTHTHMQTHVHTVTHTHAHMQTQHYRNQHQSFSCMVR
jgi:hypothetical protein